MKRRVYVVDDDGAVRQSLRLLLTVQQYAATSFASGAALVDAMDGLLPGCVLLDMRMPRVDGTAVLDCLSKRDPPLPTVVMTGHGDVSIGLTALQGGALGFLEKPFTKAALLAALHTAFLKLEAPEEYDRRLREAVARIDTLVPHQRHMLAQLAAGHTNETMSRTMNLDPASVEIERTRLLNAMGVLHLHDALRIAFAAGYGGAA